MSIRSAVSALDAAVAEAKRDARYLETRLADMRSQYEFMTEHGEELGKFIRRPYLLRPIGRERYELIIPRFIGLNAGWPVRVEGEYAIFLVSRFVDLITPLPSWLKKDLDWGEAEFKAHIEGDWLVVDSGDPEKVFKALGKSKRFSRREGNRFKVIEHQRIQVLRDLIRKGILPYNPKPIPAKLFRKSQGTVKLRPKQERDFNKLKEYGAVSVFGTGGSGKTFFSMAAADVLKGRKLVLAPRKSILQQWRARIKKYEPHTEAEFEFRTYQSLERNPLKGHYALVIFDEIQHMPAAMGIRAASVSADVRIGLSATPWREDGNEDLIPALCGVPVGADWESGETAETTIWLVNSEDEKFDLAEKLLEKKVRGKTMLFVYRIAVGKELAERLEIPFVYGGSKRQYEEMQEADTFVVSKVGDAGVSLDVSRVIEIDWLGGRAEAGQRALRTRHASEKGELHVLMTRAQYARDAKRISALYALDFDIKINDA